MRIRQFVIDGLGHLSTLISDDSAGVAAVIDPRRDVDVYLDAAVEAGLRITHVVETHLHNDYVSGGRELAALTGATHVIGGGAGLGYEHRPVRNGDGFSIGSLRFGALETPGHTPEHVSYAVADTARADEPLLLFTGGSLLVGAVGRTDLLGLENAVPYARAMFHSLHDVLLPHEDSVAVHPTHGGGSLCSTGISSTPNSTIGFERRYNPMLAPREVDDFARALLADQPAFPPYFARMRPINQAGPRLLGAVPAARPMTTEEVRAALERDALLVDLRPPAAHAIAHVPGSVSIPAGTSFSTWLGWIVDLDRPIVLLLDDPAEWDDAVRQALRIGHESVLGYLDGGLERWIDTGGAIERAEQITIVQLAGRLRAAGSDGPFVIDVRQRSEFEEGHIAGSVHLFAGELPSRMGEMPRDRPIVAICASGYRSSVAASLLRQAGFTNVSAVANGVPAWESSGRPVERGGVGAKDKATAMAERSHRH